MQEENAGVEDVKVAVDKEELHQSEEKAQAKSPEYNFSEMRRGFNELKGQLEAERLEKEEIKRQLEAFKTGFKKAFEPEQPQDDSDDQLLTVAEFEKRLQKQKLQQEIDEVPQRYADYYDVVKFVEPLVKDNPALLDAIQNSRNPRLAAYQLVKNSYAYKAATQKQDANEVEKNLNKPIPSEAIAGGSGFESSNRPMSLSEKADVWKMARMYASGRV